MTRTSTFLGPLAALFLVLGTSGVALAQASDSETVSVEVTSGVCAIDLRISPILSSFGTWIWDANVPGYVPASPDTVTTVQLIGYWLTAPYDRRCDVTVAFTGLKYPNGGPVAIDTSHFLAASLSRTIRVRPDAAGWTDTNLEVMTAGSPMYIIYLTLDSIPSGTPPGTYSGTVTISVANAA